MSWVQFDVTVGLQLTFLKDITLALRGLINVCGMLLVVDKSFSVSLLLDKALVLADALRRLVSLLQVDALELLLNLPGTSTSRRCRLVAVVFILVELLVSLFLVFTAQCLWIKVKALGVHEVP